MRVGLTLAFFLATCGCDGEIVIAVDDGGSLPPSMPEDAGPGREPQADGGHWDAGAPDSGVLMGTLDPPPPPANPSADDPPYVEGAHVCEGDEDICEPESDVGYAPLDVLAVWSRVENDEFIVQVLMRGTALFPYAHGTLSLLVDEAGRDGPLDVRECANADVPPCPLWELGVRVDEVGVYGALGIVGAIWPPRYILVQHAVVANEGIWDMEYLDERVRYALDGRIVEIRLPLSLVSHDGVAPLYSVHVNYGGDLMLGDEGHVPAFSSGGRMDDALPQLPETFYYVDLSGTE